MSGLGRRLREWHPAPPPLPDHLSAALRPDDPEWFARELAIAAAPPWWFWTFLLRRFGWVISIVGRIEVTGVGRPVPATGSGRVLLAVDGRLAVHAAGTADGLVLVRGEAAFATAGEDLRVGGSGTLFVAGPGV